MKNWLARMMKAGKKKDEGRHFTARTRDCPAKDLTPVPGTPLQGFGRQSLAGASSMRSPA
jgi:hypothetical protein